jgi:hypothetical protein
MQKLRKNKENKKKEEKKKKTWKRPRGKQSGPVPEPARGPANLF